MWRDGLESDAEGRAVRVLFDMGGFFLDNEFMVWLLTVSTVKLMTEGSALRELVGFDTKKIGSFEVSSEDRETDE